MQTLVFYISGHGFGHASRVIEVINALLAADPGLRIIVRTAAAKWLFDLTVRGPITHNFVECDTGIVQIDSLHLNEAETVRRARTFMTDFDAHVAQEAAFLRNSHASLVVADIPPLGIAAATRAGLPAVAYSNFTWDWIYSAYPNTDDLVHAIGTTYANADVALRLPMHGGFATMSKIVDLPFVARRSSRDPGETRERLGLPQDERLVLVSFGGYGLDSLSLHAVEGYLPVVSAFSPTPAAGRRGVATIDETAMYADGLRYEDLVRAVDAVVTKPGYGIISECIANDTAMLYTDRGHFIEYDALVAALPRFLRAVYIDHENLFAGRWRAHLDALLAQPPPPERPATNGAEVAANLLLRLLHQKT